MSDIFAIFFEQPVGLLDFSFLSKEAWIFMWQIEKPLRSSAHLAKFGLNISISYYPLCSGCWAIYHGRVHQVLFWFPVSLSTHGQKHALEIFV